jgi:hypothetical protein
MAKVMKAIGNDIAGVIATGCRDSSVARERCSVPRQILGERLIWILSWKIMFTERR